MAKTLRGHLGILCMACVVVLSLSSLGGAQPTLPFNPWGTVTINGSPAPDGSVVEAYINDTLVATMPGGTVNGYYSIIVPGDDPATPGSVCGIEGAEVTLKVNGNIVLPRLQWTCGSTDQIDLTLAPKTLVVNQTCPACTVGDAYYASIQDAVDLANAGDTVIVCPGTYDENVLVDVSVEIVSYGGPAVTIVNASFPYEHVFKLRAEEVSVRGFGVTGTKPYPFAGISVEGARCTVSDNNAFGGDIGIMLLSSGNRVMNNTVSANRYGIWLYNAGGNTITNNTIADNALDGMHLEYATNNFIYRNEFVNNTAHAYSSKSSDTWNSPGKMAYRYASQLWVNYLGNYWDDYTGPDMNGDGIGDVPYPINGDNDSYPLIASPAEYETPAVVCSFDTGAPTNPYPSISGMHNGTITPNGAVIVSRLFTYPCPGTGGHTEYAAVYNATGALVAEATWSGYNGDWRNLSFEPPFLLEANETYRYTIRTGSYPQIHHTHALHTAAGWINCSEFVDPTGKSNDEWIPAIKLAWLPTTTEGVRRRAVSES